MVHRCIVLPISNSVHMADALTLTLCASVETPGNPMSDILYSYKWIFIHITEINDKLCLSTCTDIPGLSL